MTGTVDTALLSPVVLVWLTFNFLSTMGENYFMDIITINGWKQAGNWMFIGDALSKVVAGAIQSTPGHRWKDQNHKILVMASIASLIDATGKIFIFKGIAMSSAQARAILGTSTTVWAALFSYVSLGRVVSPLQWAGIATIMFGMYVKKDWSKAFNDGDQVALGYLFILVGMAFHVLSGVVVEYCSRKRSFPAPKLGCLMGMINILVWYIEEFFREGQLKSFERMPFDDGKGYFFNFGTGLAWPVYFVFSTIHYSAYFNLMGTAGLVTITATKSLVTAGYVGLSAFAFCNYGDNKMSEYCLWHKWLWLPPFVQGTVASAVACLAGVILYSYGTHVKDVRDARALQQSSKSFDEVIDADLAGKDANMDCETQFDASDRISGEAPKGYGSV